MDTNEAGAGADTATQETESAWNVPIIVDVGRRSKKSIRKLKQGRGPLLDDVEYAVDQVRAQLGDIAEGKEVLPVVVLVREKKVADGPAIGWPFCK